MAALSACRVVLLSFLLAALPGRLAAAEPVTVFAAASLTDALQAVATAYEEKSGAAVRFSFASSSTLARQIAAGAPADIFASANETWMDDLATRGLLVAGTRISPIGNSLALIAPAASPRDRVTVDAALDLAGLLGTGRLALGDPAHVPAGIYARQALQSLGLWPSVTDRLAPSSDVRAALALVGRGEVPLAIVYGTDARLADGVKTLGMFPADSHPPITYPFAIVAGHDRPAVRAFFVFLTGREGLSVIEGFGFRPNTGG